MPRQAPPRYTADDEEEGRSWGKIFAVSVLGLLLFFGAGIAGVIYFLPVDLVQERLIAEVKAKTGRDLVIGKQVSFSVWPRLTVALGDVTLSDPPSMTTGIPLLKVKSIEAQVQMWPLIVREVAVDRLVLREPVIRLRVDAQGRRNWQFADLLPPRPVRYAQAGSNDLRSLPKDLQDFAKGGTTPAVRAGKNRGPVDQLSLEDVRLVDGTIHYLDDRTGQVEQIQAVNLELKASGLAAALETSGNLTWRGQPLMLTSKVTPFRALLEDQPMKVAANVQGAPLALAFDGTVNPLDASADGKLSFKTASLEAMTAWLGRPVKSGASPDPLDFLATTRISANAVSLSDVNLLVAGVKAGGGLTVETGGIRPYVKGSIRLSNLDLAAFSGIQVAPAAAPPTRTAPAASPASIDDLLKDAAPKPPAGKAPQVRGFLQRNTWSDDPLDTAALDLIDADLKISFDRLSTPTVRTGPGQITTHLKNKAARVTIDDLQLYEGRARGVLTVDGNNPVRAVVGGNMILDGVSALPLLTDLAQVDVLAGRARISVALAGQGNTERQIIETMNGKAEMSMASGAVVGFSLPKLLQGIGQGRIPQIERVPTDKTDFSEFAGSASIVNGIAQNQDLRITTALARITGSGTINLPQRSLDYMLKPKLTGGQTIQIGQTSLNVGSVEVPVRVTGTFDKIAVAPELGNLLKNPTQAIDAVKQLDRKEVESTVKGILQGDGASKAKAKDFLNNLLKR
jgi:AsmA protein